MSRFAKATFTLAVVGKLGSDHRYVQQGVDEYLKRLRVYGDVRIIEVAECKQSGTLSEEQIKQQEAASLLKLMQQASYTIALSERGQQLDSPALAAFLGEQHPAWNPLSGGGGGQGCHGMLFVVGGSLGLHESVLQAASWVWSLSKLTFPHPMVRLLWAEQLYRVCRILNGQPYHK